MQEIELFVMLDENGDYAICKERTELQEAYDNDVGTSTGELATRIIAVTLKVPLPKAIVVTATVPAEASTAAVSVK